MFSISRYIYFVGIAETLENTDDFGGPINEPSENSIKINSNGMKFINESGLYTLIASVRELMIT